MIYSTDDMFVSNQMQLLPARRSCYFSLPWMLQNFPFKTGLMEMPGLALSASVAQVKIGKTF